ncbi:hypothetical protein N7501_010293 [Penicillium viridicatum]|nr:hypothetical protein N7501_010293 [Penicillium viridicatum]
MLPKRYGRPAMMTTRPENDGTPSDGYCKPTAGVPAAAHLANMNRECQWVLNNVRPQNSILQAGKSKRLYFSSKCSHAWNYWPR